MSFTTVRRPRSRTSLPTPRPANASPRTGVRAILHLKTAASTPTDAETAPSAGDQPAA